MDKRCRFLKILVLVLALSFVSGRAPEMEQTRINGICLTAPPRPFPAEHLDALQTVSAGWIAVIPYAFSTTEKPGVWFNSERQWWGERTEGVVAQVRYARERKLRVMIKPHVWVMQQGWLGDYDAGSDEAWKTWEAGYRSYIMHYARLADSLDAEMFCIGTEARVSVRKRPAFWHALIAEVRSVYDGPLTYAANWDHMEQVPFWTALDYIGVDAYFPLLDDPQPGVEALFKAWDKPYQQLLSLHKITGKPVLFTEYGYLSVDGAAGRNWELESKLHQLPINLQAQSDAFEALYKRFWHEPWFGGGFIWKWYLRDQAGGSENRDYTPQGKPVSSVIRRYYQ